MPLALDADGDAPRRASPVLAIALVAPLVFLAVGLLRSPTFVDYYDTALIQLRTRDVGAHALLVGPYSRFTWSHPGPALFWLLAVPYRLAGADASALGVAALVLGALALGAAIYVARDAGTDFLLAIALTTLVLMHGLGAAILVDAWNPSVTLLPFLAFVIIAWRGLEGSVVALPVGAFIGSFLVQSHLGYAPTVAVGYGALAIGWWRSRHLNPRRSRIVGAATLVMLTLLWAAPLFDQFWRTGNLGKIGDYFTSSGETAGPHFGLVSVSGELSPKASWIRGFSDANIGKFLADAQGGVPYPWLLLPVVLAAAYAARRGWMDILRYTALVAVMMWLSVFAVGSIRGALAPYLVRWVWVLGSLMAAVPVWVVLRVLTERIRSLASALLVVTLAAGLVLAVTLEHQLPPKRLTGQPSKATIDQLVSAVAQQGVRGKTVLLTPDPEGSWIYVVPTLAVELERRGIHVAVPRSLASQFGKYRTNPRQPYEVIVATGPEIDRLGGMQGLQLLTRAQQSDLDVGLFVPRA